MRRASELSARAIRGDDQGYVAYHAARYAYLLEVLAKHGLGTDSKVLDIGPSRLTTLIRERFGIAVDSLGFGEDRVTAEGRHFAFDLNLAQRRENWRRDLPRYDFVVMAEVLEHLYTSPQLVLSFVRTLLSDGGRLVLQTPNAASLPKRLKLLLGRNPSQMIRLDPQNPGHFREYTRRELAGLAAELGFQVEQCTVAFYFDARFAHHESGEAAGRKVALGALKNAVYRLLPSSLREGITMVWRNSKAAI
ncbi:MAG TPA: class I SAM-dependent methyltransferase [Thermoanaerobaculia bacterium]|jgi:SAM-dependent methyltransferase|nr:class I SAM-dependent methyltransferase [Thermoanaerobaculia bacterium]